MGVSCFLNELSDYGIAAACVGCRVTIPYRVYLTLLCTMALRVSRLLFDLARGQSQGWGGESRQVRPNRRYGLCHGLTGGVDLDAIRDRFDKPVYSGCCGFAIGSGSLTIAGYAR